MPRIENELPNGFELSGNSRKYTIIKKLGAGGFGITYKVKAPVTVGTIRMTANFCIKEFFPASDCERLADSRINYSNPARERVENARRDFISEASRLKKIGFTHHNIVGFDEVFEANNTAYYVMEFVDGESLREYVERRGALSEEETRSLMWPILDAMSLLHKSHICHLDIKPGNIMLGHEENGELRPVLIDFGLSKHYDQAGRPTTTVKTLGVSEGYSPREQYSGISAFSPESDIYALGATLWFCLTGLQPKSSLMLRDGELAAELPETVSPQMRRLIERMTLDIHTRPKSIEELDINGESDAAIETVEVIPPVVESEETVIINPDRKPRKEEKAEVRKPDAASPPQPPVAPVAPPVVPSVHARQERKKPSRIIYVIIAAALVVGVVIALAAIGSDEESSDEGVAVESASKTVPAQEVADEPAVEEPQSEPAVEVRQQTQTETPGVPAPTVKKKDEPKAQSQVKPTVTNKAESQKKEPKPKNHNQEQKKDSKIGNSDHPVTNNF